MEEGEARHIAIIHYNTPELTIAAIKSVRKNSGNYKFLVFDNSDERPFQKMDGVTILDNTEGQLIDFDAMLDKYPDKKRTACNWGSEKHIASVDYLFDVLPDGFILMDSDVLVRKDISCFFDDTVAWAGTIERDPEFKFQAQRCYPMLLWINVPMLRKNNIRFFHDGFVYKMSHNGAPYYDTGASLYKDCNDAGLPYKEIDIFKYIEHYGGGSYDKDKRRSLVWLEIFRGLYE